MTHDPAQEPSHGIDPEEFSLQITNYRLRKRWLLDQIKIQSTSRRATMLLDQRHRLTAMVAKSNFIPSTRRSTWVAEHELWTALERKFPLKRPNPVTTHQAWMFYACESDKLNTNIDQFLMVQAIRRSGLSIAPEAWRQRVARYLREVREQVDEDEWRYFHAKS